MTPTCETCDVAIIGAGFAGLAAADILMSESAKVGMRLDVRMIDENPHVGGQLLRNDSSLPSFFRSRQRNQNRKTDDKKNDRNHGDENSDPKSERKGNGFELDPTRHHGFSLKKRVADLKIPMISGTRVAGIFPGNHLLLVDSKERASELKARYIIVATGAREKYLPFPGWTLPGVISTGAAQILMKSSGILPASKLVVGGLGPLQYLFADEMRAKKGRVLSVLDHASFKKSLSMVGMIPHHTLKLMDGALLMARLTLAGVPLRRRMKIIEAQGTSRLETVVAAKVDSDGNVLSGSEIRIDTPVLAVGYGFVPNIELLCQAGCQVDYDASLGGWVARVDDSLETSQKGIFTAGEVTGIAGASKSLIEGRIAGMEILRQMNIGNNGALSTSTQQFERLCRKRQHELHYARLFNTLCRIPPSWIREIPDETMICRCEDVRMKDINLWMKRGFTTPGAMKKAVRTGMGNCQGRICGTVIQDLMTAKMVSSPSLSVAHNGGPITDKDIPSFAFPSVRVPVKPIGLDALADLALSPQRQSMDIKHRDINISR